jgi:hypothetical protein
MKYKNGREAKAGDAILHVPTGERGILEDTVNGRVGKSALRDTYVSGDECLHADDADKTKAK